MCFTLQLLNDKRRAERIDSSYMFVVRTNIMWSIRPRIMQYVRKWFTAYRVLG